MKSLASLVAAILALALGCSRPAAGPGASPQATGDAAAVSGEPAVETDAAADVEVQLKTWEQAQELIAGHRGKVTVVDLWSTWCVPCVKEFPHLVELHGQLGEQIACVSVNLDYDGAEGQKPEENLEKVKRFLIRQGAAFDNVLCLDPIEDVLNDLEAGSIPVVLVYDKQGSLAKVFQHDEQEYGQEGFSYEGHIIPLVKELLAQEAPAGS